MITPLNSFGGRSPPYMNHDSSFVYTAEFSRLLTTGEPVWR